MLGLRAVIREIAYHLPNRVVTNQDLAADFPEWTPEKIESKTGILERRIAAPAECASDLGVAAAQKLFEKGLCRATDIDYILFCTQSPDHFLPTSACIMQHRLNVRTSAGALDFNLGCSGFVYGLGLSKALVETGQARSVLLITAETYSKFIHPKDKSVRTLFGDAGAATLVCGVEASDESIGPFVYGTDGGGAKNLIVRAGGLRCPTAANNGEVAADSDGNLRTEANLYMNGPEIFAFTLRVVPLQVQELLARAEKQLSDIDLFIFHQANEYILEHLRKKLRIPSEKFFVAMREFGNTVSCTIPIALKQASEQGRIRSRDLVMLVGFGVGYSWGATLVRWH